MKNKKCNKCGKVKNESEFGKNCKCLRSWCKDCVNTDGRKKYASNPDKYREQRHSWKKRNPTRVKYSNYLQHGFNRTFTDWLEITTQPCYYCGHIDLPCNGIDRVDSNKGYEKNNCVPCCGVCNKMKSNYNIKDFIKKCKQIVEKQEVMAYSK